MSTRRRFSGEFKAMVALDASAGGKLRRGSVDPVQFLRN